MRRIVIATSLAALTLASCTTTRIDAALAKTLPQACAALETAHLVFLSLVPSGNISDKTIAKEAAAYGGAQVVCADPKNVTAADALVRAAAAYAIVASALKEARHG